MRNEFSINMFVFCLILLGCTQVKKEKGNSNDITRTQFESDNLENTNPNKQESDCSEQLTDCEFDSLRFMASMGKGVAEIHYKMSETVYFNSSELSDSLGKLFLNKGQLQLQFNKDTFPINWFLYPTEYRDGSVISLRTRKNAIQLKVEGLPDSLECWIEKKQRANGRPINQFIDWRTYLSHQTLWITEDQLRSNPFRTSPNDTADTIIFDFKYPVFELRDYENPWLLLSTLTYKSNGSKGSSDKMSEPIGWYKWYCADTVQLFIPSYYDLEYFYSPQYYSEE